ncbi:DUF3592 domain-containing protein [Shewanella chilikensis]|uniref:DUF3592 domain-containing protein n=1 Tax=Shewanella chilikensis TaxID=558541 RepID=A0A6G7LVK0_9GAMM|nr:DUF3592 domain-containing protein [Shewanella chilikensis]MCL1163330.1 hypothetical protein [Shewanella chilikensis]QIJ05818.1 hypothetical protein GII14_17800 [Shewanella chilikensis]
MGKIRAIWKDLAFIGLFALIGGLFSALGLYFVKESVQSWQEVNILLERGAETQGYIARREQHYVSPGRWGFGRYEWDCLLYYQLPNGSEYQIWDPPGLLCDSKSVGEFVSLWYLPEEPDIARTDIQYYREQQNTWLELWGILIALLPLAIGGKFVGKTVQSLRFLRARERLSPIVEQLLEADNPAELLALLEANRASPASSYLGRQALGYIAARPEWQVRFLAWFVPVCLKWEQPSKGEGVSGLGLSLQLALGRRYPEFTLALLDGIRSLFAEHELAKMVFSQHLAELQRKPWSAEIQKQFNALLLGRQMPLGDKGFIHTEVSRLVCLEWLFNNLESLPGVWPSAASALLKALVAQPPLNPLSRKQRKKQALHWRYILGSLASKSNSGAIGRKRQAQLDQIEADIQALAASRGFTLSR